MRYAKLQEERMSGDAVSEPGDIARMKEDKNINLMEQAGLNVGYPPITRAENRWMTSKFAALTCRE